LSRRPAGDCEEEATLDLGGSCNFRIFHAYHESFRAARYLQPPRRKAPAFAASSESSAWVESGTEERYKGRPAGAVRSTLAELTTAI
jgi:hypothetical protein